MNVEPGVVEPVEIIDEVDDNHRQTNREYEKLFIKYSGPEMEPTEPVLPPGKKIHVLVVHDESIFHSNDGKRVVWVEEEGRVIRPKGKGRAVMISDFFCECHGELYHEEEGKKVYAREIISPSKNYDGYWRNDDVAKQLEEKAVRAFNYLHPDQVAVWGFDNSSNNHSVKGNGLCATPLNLSDRGKNTPLMRDTTFTPAAGVMKEQKMKRTVLVDGNGIQLQRGVKSILQERGLWKDILNLECSKKAGGCDLLGKQCCGRRILENQPDFLAQKCWLEEVSIAVFIHRPYTPTVIGRAIKIIPVRCDRACLGENISLQYSRRSYL
jgi:hypothetical protein